MSNEKRDQLAYDRKITEAIADEKCRRFLVRAEEAEAKLAESIEQHEHFAQFTKEWAFIANKMALVLQFYSSEWRGDIYTGPTAELLEDFGTKATEMLTEFNNFKEQND